MFTRYDLKHRLERVTIDPGEYYTTDSNKIIYTVLGSCISVCLKDEHAGIAGMNHFLLPDPPNIEKKELTDSGRYGIHAMELLIGEMLQRGAAKKRLKAKVFGGGHIIKSIINTVSTCNIDFAFQFLNIQRIPITAHDIGGILGRKITFFTEENKVYVEKIKSIQKDQYKNIAERYRKLMASPRPRTN